MQKGMTLKADFAPSYDFSDENFVRLKDELFVQLKTDFVQRLEKARDKPYALESEKNRLAKQQKRTVEVYGSLLLTKFDEVFRSGSKPVQAIINDFVQKHVKTSTKWVKRYEIEHIQNNSEFKNLGSAREFELLVLMSTWAKENPGFEGQPTNTNNFPFDISRTDALHYFEKLAEYQAKKEYAAFIQGFEIATGTEDIEKPSKGNAE